MKNDTRVNATRMPIASVQLSGAVKADQGCRSIPFLTVLRLRGIRHSGQWISIRAPALDLEAAAGMDSVLRRARVRVAGGEEERQRERVRAGERRERAASAYTRERRGKCVHNGRPTVCVRLRVGPVPRDT